MGVDVFLLCSRVLWAGGMSHAAAVTSCHPQPSLQLILTTATPAGERANEDAYKFHTVSYASGQK